MSNRTPRMKEIERGVKYVLNLVDIFDIQYIGCIGKKSYDTLKVFHGNLIYLRHPSCSGINKFREMIDKLMENYLWKKKVITGI